MAEDVKKRRQMLKSAMVGALATAVGALTLDRLAVKTARGATGDSWLMGNIQSANTDNTTGVLTSVGSGNPTFLAWNSGAGVAVKALNTGASAISVQAVNDSVGARGVEFLGNGVNTHFPFSDGQNYITGDRRGGATGTGDTVFRTFDGSSYVTRAVVKGDGNGVQGFASSGGVVAAIRGENSSAAASAYGVLGRFGGAPLPAAGEAGAAVRGISPLSASGQGVVGTGGNGVVGFGLFAGVHGQGASASAVGVRGVSALAAGVPGGSTVAIQSTGDLLPDSDNTRSCGSGVLRWTLVRGVAVVSGDFGFENGARLTENEPEGIALVNPNGEKIAVFDWQGNLRIKGDVVKDPTL